MVLLCFLLIWLLIAAVTAASASYLAKRDLQADCDGAAVAGADGINPNVVYNGQLSQHEALPVATEYAQAAVDEYRARLDGDSDSLAMVARVDEDNVVVACQRIVHVPFGVLFGLSNGVTHHAEGSARSPLR